VPQAGSGPILLTICSIHSVLLLLFSYVIMVSSMELNMDNLMCLFVLGDVVWSLFSLVQVRKYDKY
jgi:hypothetical protein